MGLFKRLIKLNGAMFLGGSIFTAYNYPELRKDPEQFLNAM